MRNEKGQMSIFVIVAVFIATVFFIGQGKTTVSSTEGQVCASVNPSRKVKLGNDWYVQVREKSALSTDQFRWHLIEQGVVESRRAWIPQTTCNLARGFLEGGLPPDSNFTQYCNEDIRDRKDRPSSFQVPNKPRDLDFLAKDLLFLEISVPPPPPGFVNVEIFVSERYLNEHKRLPEFITSYCEAKQPVDPQVIFPDKQGTMYPPPYVYKKDINPSPSALSDNAYTLFSFARSDSPIGVIYLGAPVVGTYEYNGRSYDVRIVSYAGYAALTDRADSTNIYVYTQTIPIPNFFASSAISNSLQIKSFDPFILQPWGWWSPECKPAIYLYPKEKTQVTVKVQPKGFLTYTDPLYPPAGGWNIISYPDGKIETSGKRYEYLYYESKIHNLAIDKPAKGYIAAYKDLPDLYDNLLPKLGMNEKETKDFKDYWEPILPKAPYYFVGVMNDKSIEKIEPLQIFPKPDTIIRVRLYFEPLSTFEEAMDKKATVEDPLLFENHERKGFVVSEWGGLIKTDPTHPFTCSQ